MGVRSWFGLSESTSQSTEVTILRSELEVLQEGVAELQLALEDEGWAQISTNGEREFSRDGLRKAADLCRVLAVAHPLIKRGLAVRQAYVWGQGVTIQARDDQVNEVIQAFIDDPGNRRAFTGGQAQEELERALGTDGNVFLAAFTNPRNGFVQVRSIPFDEVVDIITNPDDRDDPWFYRRQWQQRVINTNGQVESVTRTAFYPALDFRPTTRARTIDGHEIVWDAPILHVNVNKLDGWAFGIGDAYAALTWARGYRDFLTDWATLVKSLSQIAFQATGKGSRTQKLRERLARRTSTTGPDGNPNSVGATVVMPEGMTLEAIPKTGATVDSGSGKPLAAMVAAALGVPVTVLLADPGTTGARAVAETLDGPMQLEMKGRRSLWSAAMEDLFSYVIKQAIKAPAGPLQGIIVRDPFTGREVVQLAGDLDAGVDIDWPALDDLPLKEMIDAIVAADGTGKMPPEEVVKLLLRALRVKNIDEVLEEFLDENGKFVDPYANAGQAAADAFRRGEDPAAIV